MNRGSTSAIAAAPGRAGLVAMTLPSVSSVSRASPQRNVKL